MLTVDDLAWLRDEWPRKLIVKGIQSVEDARMVVERGADAIVLSNHGGRQLDRAPTPLAAARCSVDGSHRPRAGVAASALNPLHAADVRRSVREDDREGGGPRMISFRTEEVAAV